jgi:hypothetical protein
MVFTQSADASIRLGAGQAKLTNPPWLKPGVEKFFIYVLQALFAGFAALLER